MFLSQNLNLMIQNLYFDDPLIPRDEALYRYYKRIMNDAPQNTTSDQDEIDASLHVLQTCSNYTQHTIKNVKDLIKHINVSGALWL